MNDVQEYIENRRRIRELESRNRELAENFNQYGRRYLPSFDNAYYIRRVVKTHFEFSNDLRALEEQREQLTQYISEQSSRTFQGHRQGLWGNAPLARVRYDRWCQQQH